MRSIWKGHIRFLLVAIPVRVYNAIETSEQIHLNQLHKDDYGPIGYDKRCKKCNKVASKDDIIKGYQYAKDQYAILEPDDLAKVKLKTTKVIDIVGFIDKAEIPPMLYDSPYFVGPDGEVGAKTYALLREVLKDTGKVGLGKVVLRDREDFIARVRRALQAEHLHGHGRLGPIYRLAVFIEHGAHAAELVARDDRVAELERAFLDEHRGDRAAALLD